MTTPPLRPVGSAVGLNTSAARRDQIAAPVREGSAYHAHLVARALGCSTASMLRAAVAEYLQARAAQLEHVSDDLAIVLQACTDPDFRQGRRPASRSSAPDPLS